MIFVGYFGYKGFIVYFVQKTMDDTFVGGSSSDITVTLWFAMSAAMTLPMLLFFQFIKLKDLKSQSTILKGMFVGWAGICAALIIFIPSYIYFVILTAVASVVSLVSSLTLKDEIIKQLDKKETLSEKEIYLLQKLAGIKKPKL